MVENIFKRINYEVVLIILIGVFELFHTAALFKGADFLAGGDNYSYLQLGRNGLYPYVWDSNSIALGGINVAIPDLFGFPLYTSLFRSVSGPVLEKVLIFLLYFFRYIAFIKLVKFLSKKLSLYAIIPALLLFTFNAFESLNPFSFFPLMYSVYLPFSLYYFIKLYSSDKFDLVNLSKLILLSAIFAPINANIALAVTVFIPQVVYIIYSIRSFSRVKFLNLFVYYFVFLVASLWWLVPLLLYFLNSANQILSNNWFTSTDVGDLASNFRFIGQWGWYGIHFLHYYYPFSKYYDNFLVVFATFCVVIFAFLGIGLKKFNKPGSKSYNMFFMFLALVSLFLVGGTRAPFGFIYKFLYNKIFLFKIFREPFTKFTEIYVLSVSILFYFSLLNLERILNRKKTIISFLIIFALVIVSVKPSLFSEHVWSQWNGSMRTVRIKVPYYWEDFAKYVSANIKNSRILTIPKVYYGSAWSWPSGISSADDVAVNFVGTTNNILRNPLSSVGGDSGHVIDNFFNKNHIFDKYVSMLGAEYILQENDLDWRYFPPFSYSPDETAAYVEKLGLQKVAEFGNFSDSYLSTVKNDEPNETIHDDLYTTLINKPALVLYKVDVDKVLPKFYIPKEIIYSSGSVFDLPYISDLWSNSFKNAVYLGRFNSGKNRFLNLNIADSSNRIILFPQTYSTKIKIASLEQQSNWALPQVNVDPGSFEYKLLMLKEKIDLLDNLDSLSRLDLLSWYSAKRVSELLKFSLFPDHESEVINSLIKTINKTVDVLSAIPDYQRTNDFWEMVKKVYTYSERSFGILSTLKTDLSQRTEIISTKNRLMNYITEINGTNCGEFCYKLSVPENGKYDLYVDTQFVKSLDLQKDQSVQEVLDPALFLKDLTLGEFKSFGSTDKFAELKDWEAETQYKVTFDYRVGASGLGFMLIEEMPKKYDPQAIVRKNSIRESLNAYEVNAKNMDIIKDLRSCKFLDNDNCYAHYEKTITSSKEANNVIILFESSVTDLPIRNIKIQKIVSPQVVLIRNREAPIIDTTPKLIFREINPTKYIVHVSGATQSYYLVFNETFNKYWRVYNVNTTDNNIFRGWGRKDILSQKHYIVNGFANSWLVSPQDVKNMTEYDLVIEFLPQRIFYLGIFFVLAILTFCSLYLVFNFFINMAKRKNA